MNTINNFVNIRGRRRPTRARARRGARALEEFCIVHSRKVGMSVGLLKGPQNFSIHVLGLHVESYVEHHTALS